MEQILTQICGELNNWFDDHGRHAVRGTFAIKGGTLLLDNIAEGQCVRIVSSKFNDGVHMFPFYDLQDETFTGSIIPMRIPTEVMTVAAEIQRSAEDDATGGGLSPYTSESFGGYSYTRATDSNGVPADWRTLYARKLDRWRKLP